MGQHTLKNGQIADIGFDVIPFMDGRSLEYPIASATVSRKPQTTTWDCPAVLDQGRTGGCVGFAITTELIAAPTLMPVDQYNNDFALRIYYRGQHLDPFPGGAYKGATPRYHGTTLIAGIKAAKEKKAIKGYRWAFSFRAMKLGLTYRGPATVVIPWSRRLATPDSGGFIKLGRWDRRSYHAITVLGLDMENKYLVFQNSWGDSWGDKGRAKMMFAEWLKISKIYSEIAFLTDKEIQ